MPKKAKPNSISRSPRVAKKRPIDKRGFIDRFGEAYRWFNLSMFAYNNFDKLKSFFDQLIE